MIEDRGFEDLYTVMNVIKSHKGFHKAMGTEKLASLKNYKPQRNNCDLHRN